MNAARLDPADAHEREVARALAFGDLAGDVVVVGDPPPAVLLGLGAAAAGVTWCGSGRAGREAKRLLEAWTPVHWNDEAPDGDGAPRLDDPVGGALVWGVPEKGGIDRLESALVAVADGGPILLSLPREDPKAIPATRLLAALCGEEIEALPNAPRSRVAYRGRRVSPIPGELVDDVPEPLPMTVLVRCVGSSSASEGTLLDVLLRQNWPASRVYVLDDSNKAQESIPEDLWGFAPRSRSRIALFPSGGREAAESFDDALGGVETPYVLMLEAGDRLTPNHLAILGLALEAAPRAAAALGGALSAVSGRFALPVHERANRLVRVLLEGERPLLGAGLFRTEALVKMGGLDPKLGEAGMLDLWLRVGEESEVVPVPVPIVSRARLPLPSGSDVVAFLAQRKRGRLARLAREFEELPNEERPGAFHLARGRSIGRLGDCYAARDDLELALDAEVEPREAELELVLNRLAAGEALTLVEVIDPDEDSAPECLVHALALAAIGRATEAKAHLERLEARPRHRLPESLVKAARLVVALAADSPAARIAFMDWVDGLPDEALPGGAAWQTLWRGGRWIG